MNIGIITFEFNYNYGAILQATALSDYLRNRGHTTKIINRGWGQLPHRVADNYLSVRNILNRVIGGYWSNKYLNRFKHTHWVLTDKIDDTGDYACVYDEFDAIIVGSDQIWNSACIETMGLHYWGINADVERQRLIAYAPSFGKNRFEAGNDTIKEIQRHLKKFWAISVREADGIEILKKYFDIKEVVRVLDPTMLMSKVYYCEMSGENKIEEKNTLAYYILDDNSEKEEYISCLSKLTGLKPKNIGKGTDTGNVLKKIKNLRYPSIESWLRNIAECKMFVTDSFHGTVFSIIFNKDFLTFGNACRGNSRFDNLLSMFGLEDRLIRPDKNCCVVPATIDYELVNKRMNYYQNLSKNFLDQSLE